MEIVDSIEKSVLYLSRILIKLQIRQKLKIGIIIIWRPKFSLLWS